MAKWQHIIGCPTGDGISRTDVYWDKATGCVRIEVTSDGRFRAGEGPTTLTPESATEDEHEVAAVQEGK